jgi:hypothetical protein
MGYNLTDEYIRNMCSALDNFSNSINALTKVGIEFVSINSGILEITERFCEAAINSVSVNQSLLNSISDVIYTFTNSSLVSDSLGNIFNGITLSENIVTINENAFTELSSLIDLTDEEQEATEKEIESTGKATFDFKHFITVVLFPLLLAIIPMMHTQYLHHVDSLESKRQQLEENEYKERFLEIESERLETEKQILHLMEQLIDSEKEPQSSSEIQDAALQVPESLPEAEDNPDESVEPVDNISTGSTAETTSSQKEK